MLISVMKSKISYAIITSKDLFYVGSITIDENIMVNANLRDGERVQIVNLNNGERLETYAIKGKKESGIISLNGPAARKCEIGDTIFIISYALIDPCKERIEPILINLKKGETV